MTSAPAATRRPASAWALALAWTAVILLASGDAFSASATSRFLLPLLRWLLPEASPETLAALHFAARKSAHVTEYAVLAWLAWRALRGTSRLGVAPALLALAWVLGVAVLDETHQARLESRTGAVGDVALDGAGGLAGLLLARYAPRLRRPRAMPSGVRSALRGGDV
jgi:VanZ family protein